MSQKQLVILLMLLRKMSATNSLHYKLCLLAARELKYGRLRFGHYGKCKYVAVELNVYGAENTDVWASFCDCTAVIEVKTSRADFLADKKKYWRRPESAKNQAGNFRCYLAPVGLLRVDEIPDNWGLLEYSEHDNVIYMRKRPPFNYTYNHADLIILQSILRREGFKEKIYNYRNAVSTIKPQETVRHKESQPTLF